MRFKSAILGPTSGSVGGATFSHNAGGQYVRIRATPTDPNTPQQAAVRATVASLVNHWVTTLTAGQRTAWNTYADNVPLNDVFGDPRFRTGINHYVRSNTQRVICGKARVDDGPTVFNLGEFGAVSFAVNAPLNKTVITFVDTDDWCSEDGAIMYFWQSVPQNPTINFFKGPYRIVGAISGDSGAPPTSPIDMGIRQAYTAGQKAFNRVNVSRADGRLGTPFRGECVAT